MKFFKILFSPITGTLGFLQKYFKSLLFILILILIFAPKDPSQIQKPNLAKIKLSGAIMNADKILEEIEDVQKDKNIKGVLLVVDSPGGAVAPSVEIALAIKRLNAKKPVVAYASGVMASGSYYASIWAKEIIANPAATIGSIGVILQSMNVEELAQKVGVKPQIMKIGKYKEMGTPFREWSKDERAFLHQHTKDIYDMFVSDVASARKLDVNSSTEFADAKVFIAWRAKEVGLIDEIGSIAEAKAHIAKFAKVSKPVFKEKNKIDKIFDNLANESAKSFIGQFLGYQIH